MNMIYSLSPKIKHSEDLLRVLAAKRITGKKIVFTNGCFDLLHPGHIRYLTHARSLGDFLVIGLNSDDSVKRLKGENRPIQHEAVRAEMLAALHVVDAVVVFNEDTPLNLIKAVAPDILVKGGDYTPETIVGANEVKEKGGEVVVIPFEDGFSTTDLIAKIKNG